MMQHEYQHITASADASALVISIKEANLREGPGCIALREEMLAAIDSADSKILIVDLTSVEFIGSFGLLVFLTARRRMAGGRIILCGMSENVRGVFRLCGLVSNDTEQPGPFEESRTIQSALESC